MEEKEYIVMSQEESEVVIPEEIVYESTIVPQTEEINEVFIEENIYETAVIPEVPNVIGNEQLYVYVQPLDPIYKEKIDIVYHKLDEFKNSIPSKTSMLNNDGNGNSPFATEKYVEENGGKIDSISLNGNVQEIDANKNVNLTVTTESIGAATKQDVDNIKKVIPNQASETNKLADKDFVNSSIETATATFRGTYKDLDTLKQILADKNDYTFYDHVDELGNRVFDKYKYNGTEWLYEYSLNNSSFTDVQWKAINSGATVELINKILTNEALIRDLETDIVTVENKIPTQFIKEATVSNDILTLTKNDGSSLQFEGGGGYIIRRWD